MCVGVWGGGETSSYQFVQCPRERLAFIVPAMHLSTRASLFGKNRQSANTTAADRSLTTVVYAGSLNAFFQLALSPNDGVSFGGLHESNTRERERVNYFSFGKESAKYIKIYKCHSLNSHFLPLFRSTGFPVLIAVVVVA